MRMEDVFSKNYRKMLSRRCWVEIKKKLRDAACAPNGAGISHYQCAAMPLAVL